MRKLSTGAKRGTTLVGRAERIRGLGVKTKRMLGRARHRWPVPLPLEGLKIRPRFRVHHFELAPDLPLQKVIQDSTDNGNGR